MFRFIGILLLCCLKQGEVRRNIHEVRQFEKQTGFAGGRKGYVVDHIVPFCWGKARVDSTWNYQWQRLDSSYTKNRYEVQLCHGYLTFTQYEFIVKNRKLVSDSDWSRVMKKLGNETLTKK